MMQWRRTTITDQQARAFYDTHYSRVTVGSAQFTPPGRNLVLVLPNYRALWITSHERFRKDGYEAWVCTVFRNESSRLASQLIRQALAATMHLWAHAVVPRDGLITFIDTRKVQAPPVGLPYGWTFLTAGFEEVGRTKDRDLLILQLSAARLREIAPRPVKWLDGSRQLDLLEAAS